MKKILILLLCLIPFNVKADSLLEEAERQKNAAQQFAVLMSKCENDTSDYCNEAVHSKVGAVTNAIDDLTERAKKEGLTDNIFSELETYSNVLKKSNKSDGTHSLSSGCSSIYGGGLGDWINNFFTFVKYVGLALVVVLSTMDFLKVVIGDKDDELKKAFSRFVKRFIAVILLFLTPVLIDLAFSVISETPVDICVDYIR